MSSRAFQTCRKIICVGRNYVDHCKELQNAVPSSPVLFLKPPSSIITDAQNRPIEIPRGCSNLHHEVEVGVVVGKGGRDIPLDKALSHVGGWLLCLDMTWRDEQDKAKKEGLPWCVAKGADTFAAVSHKVLPASAIQNPGDVEVWLKVNGKERQRGNTSLMLFPIPQLISHISSIFTLEEGDIIMTGTPKGVGPVGAGDVITAGMNVGRNGQREELCEMTFGVAARPAAKL